MIIDIKLWTEARRLVEPLLGHGASVLTSRLRPDSQMLASGMVSRVRDQGMGPESRRTDSQQWLEPAYQLLFTVTNHSSSINELIFTPNDKLISGADTTARFGRD